MRKRFMYAGSREEASYMKNSEKMMNIFMSSVNN